LGSLHFKRKEGVRVEGDFRIQEKNGGGAQSKINEQVKRARFRVITTDRRLKQAIGSCKCG